MQSNKCIHYLRNINNLVDINEDSYPHLLRQITDPPKQLYFRGKMVQDQEKCIGVVGSRCFSDRGRRVVIDWIPRLVKAGFTIISGLAIGIDSLVHEECIKAGGRTVAVVPAGIDPVYPKRNKYLAERIIMTGGCVISEYPNNSIIDRGKFLRRNRIVSGLSLGVLVIEAGERSGSINTPGWAAEQGREVWCVSCKRGDLNSEGIIGLIEDGANEVSRVEDVLESFYCNN